MQVLMLYSFCKKWNWCIPNTVDGEKQLVRQRHLYNTTNPLPPCLSVFVLPSSCQPGGAAADRGEAEGEAGPLEVHQALENPLLHPGGEPAALPERQICTSPPATRAPSFICVFHPRLLQHGDQILRESVEISSCDESPSPRGASAVAQCNYVRPQYASLGDATGQERRAATT